MTKVARKNLSNVLVGSTFLNYHKSQSSPSDNISLISFLLNGTGATGIYT